MADVTVGKLYMTGCGYCEQMVPAWKEMEKRVKGQIGGVVEFERDDVDGLAKFNKTHNVNVAVQDGFPTLFRVAGGQVAYHNGGRTTDELVAWAKGTTEKGTTEKGTTEKGTRETTRGGRKYGKTYKARSNKATRSNKSTRSRKNKLSRSRKNRTRYSR